MLELSGKKILVTGSSGFIGHNLVKKLIELNCDVRGTYLNEANRRHDGCEYLKCDLRLEEDCHKSTLGIDIVIMCAANSSGAEDMAKRPLTHLTPNVVMNAQMLEAAYENGVQKFVFISSSTVYPLTDFAVKEDDVNYNFYSSYHVVGWMKLFSEIMCDMYTNKIEKKMDTVMVRPSNLYGPFDKFDPKKSKVIAALVRRFSEQEDPMAVWGDGKDIKDFLYIEDFLEGLISVIKTEIVGAINICSGKQTTIRDIIEALEKITGTKPKLDFDFTKPSMIPFRTMDGEKMKQLTGWSQAISLTEGLSRTLHWYKSEGTKL